MAASRHPLPMTRRTRPHSFWTGSKRRCRAGAFSNITAARGGTRGPPQAGTGQNRIRPRFHGMAGRTGEAEVNGLNGGTFNVGLNPYITLFARSPSGWDRELESGFLQREVTCEPRRPGARSEPSRFRDSCTSCASAIARKLRTSHRSCARTWPTRASSYSRCRMMTIAPCRLSLSRL